MPFLKIGYLFHLKTIHLEYRFCKNSVSNPTDFFRLSLSQQSKLTTAHLLLFICVQAFLLPAKFLIKCSLYIYPPACVNLAKLQSARLTFRCVPRQQTSCISQTVCKLFPTVLKLSHCRHPYFQSDLGHSHNAQHCHPAILMELMFR